VIKANLRETEAYKLSILNISAISSKSIYVILS